MAAPRPTPHQTARVQACHNALLEAGDRHPARTIADQAETSVPPVVRMLAGLPVFRATAGAILAACERLMGRPVSNNPSPAPRAA